MRYVLNIAHYKIALANRAKTEDMEIPYINVLKIAHDFPGIPIPI